MHLSVSWACVTIERAAKIEMNVMNLIICMIELMGILERSLMVLQKKVYRAYILGRGPVAFPIRESNRLMVNGCQR